MMLILLENGLNDSCNKYIKMEAYISSRAGFSLNMNQGRPSRPLKISEYMKIYTVEIKGHVYPDNITNKTTKLKK